MTRTEPSSRQSRCGLPSSTVERGGLLAPLHPGLAEGPANPAEVDAGHSP